MSGADNNISERRKRNNILLGGVLIGFVALVFAITVAKMMDGQDMKSYEHTRPTVGQTQ
ncbi:MAG: cytochrome C oxidase assembly protein [Amylibacter sp.]